MVRDTAWLVFDVFAVGTSLGRVFLSRFMTGGRRKGTKVIDIQKMQSRYHPVSAITSCKVNNTIHLELVRLDPASAAYKQLCNYNI